MMKEATIEVVNPASGKAVGRVPDLTLEQVRAAIGASQAALGQIQALTIAERAAMLRKVARLIQSNAEELASTMTQEIGRPISSSKGEMARTAQIFELVAADLRGVFEGEFIPLESYEYPKGNKKRIAFVTREPVGVVGTITPFNFPASSFAHKVAPALAVGDTVVHKPTVLAPLTQLKMAALIKEAGFPDGSVSFVTGRSSMIGDEFVENPKVSMISFTGSERVGLELASRAIAKGKRVIMELGGSDAQIVLEDADLDRATEAAVFGRFDYAGQFCNSTKRLVVRAEVAAEFGERLKERVKTFKVGDPMEQDTSVGPLISREALESMRGFVAEAKGAGARVVYEGSVPQGASGHFFPPTIIQGDEKMRIAKEEVFGPILPLIEVKSDEEAVSVANSTEYGLDAAVFTRDFSRAYRMAAKLKAGTVMINDTTRLRWDGLPFGGFKKSGIGREGTKNTMIEMTESKIVEYTLD
ncbi:MAG: aldehyde dehydrogenase family protein [Nitrososphaerota archaeon]|jgi:succinyl-CoA reductase|nr:aldehyde dehydrogenase family protein [Nitrososphaerota archaeon]MDG6959841.1 aldehyde dehydrogenase family protein [Nitrososphaerota archaeon]MDG6961928.1 aldehyde dehydrogenase family protein [Nitrososphaerota archaeon]MDG6972928.1 aldehyde dehydrogenase family protein [Nitrososphaerota archaeon]MDG6987106.1 aldehyde dehydrogenase family protein [Nitrososphaerota archaeon]